MPHDTPAWASFAHRNAIDGLRAIAALVVILFHAQMPGFANGFVGVDVFFVLSGFLITSLLLRERLTAGRISLRGFYARRVRRLLPAALLVLAITAIAYQLVAPPLDVIENRAGFLFAAIYLSNWYFLGQSQDYFAADAAPSPVLHYWSLSIEEQFYLVWPTILVVLLAVALIRRRGAPIVIATLAAGALVGSWLIYSAGPAAGYFNTFARAYQLLGGAALAAGVLWWRRRAAARGAPPPEHLVVGAVLAVTGVVLIVGTATSLVSLSAWWVGVIGVVGTLSLLAGIELAPVSRVLRPLAMRPARALGRWSYSMYLWHWPVIVIAGVVGILPIEWWLRVPAVLVVTIAMAAATYRLVEAPVTRVDLATRGRQLVMVGGALAATAATAVLALVVLRVPAQAEQLVAIAQEGQAQLGDDTATVVVGDGLGSAAGQPVADASSVVGSSGARVRATSHPTTVLIVGDSHAYFWEQGFTRYAKAKGFRVVFVTSSGCPWMDIPALSDQTGLDHQCQKALWAPALAAARQYRPDVTLLISRSVLSRRLQTPSGVIRALDPGWQQIITRGTVSALAQMVPLSKQVVLIEPFPQTSTPMLTCLSEGTPAAECDQPAVQTPGTAQVEELYHALAAQYPNVVSVSFDDIICPGGTCPSMSGGAPTFVDDNHLTWDYAESLMPAVDAALGRAGVHLTGRH